MKWGRRKSKDDTETALANFALTFAKALLVINFIMLLMIAVDQKKDEGIKPKVEAIIMVDWPSDAKIDLDTWIRTPNGTDVYFNNKESGIVFLDRDDLGDKCINICEELVSLRGLNSGEYILNLNVFSSSNNFIKDDGTPLDKPLTAHIKIIKLNPTLQVLFEQDVVLKVIKEEKHIVRFKIQDEIFSFDTKHSIMLQKRIDK